VIKATYDNIIIKRDIADEVSTGGIILPDSASEIPPIGTVVSIGSGIMTDSGEIVNFSVKVGDRVTYGKQSAIEIRQGDDSLWVIKEDDIVAIIK